MAAAKRRDSGLWARITVGILFAPLVLWIFWNGGYPLFAFLALLTLFGQAELFSMTGGLTIFHRIAGHAAGLGIVADAFLYGSGHIAGILAAAIIFLFIIEIVTGGEDRILRVSFSLLATAYPALFISYLLKISRLSTPFFGSGTPFLMVYLLAAVWMFDTASYFTGMSLGKHPFFPAVSPKKTVEGFLGGFAGILALGAVTSLFSGFSLTHLLMISFLAGIAGQCGDLAESIMKRDMGIKDSSDLLPGHGGILDRFDSLFFAAPAVYCYLILFL